MVTLRSGPSLADRSGLLDIARIRPRSESLLVLSPRTPPGLKHTRRDSWQLSFQGSPTESNPSRSGSRPPPGDSSMLRIA